jgi:hypothetical protein
MGILNTYRGGYQMIQDTTSVGEVIDGSTSGKTFRFEDKPSDAMWMGEEFNGVELLFVGGYGSTVDNTPADALAGIGGDNTGVVAADTFDCVIWGWADNGPAERIVDVSITCGAKNRYDDFTTALYANKIVEVKDYHVADAAVYDADGSEGIAKIAFDTAGLRWIYCEFTDAVSTGDPTSDIAVFARPY